MFDLCNDGNQIQNRLLYCEAPPGADQATYHTHPLEVEDLDQLTFSDFINYFQVLPSPTANQNKRKIDDKAGSAKKKGAASGAAKKGAFRR